MTFHPEIGGRKFTVIYNVTESRYKQTQTDPAGDVKIEIEQIEEGGDIVDTTINDKTRMAIENLAYVHYCESK